MEYQRQREWAHVLWGAAATIDGLMRVIPDLVAEAKAEAKAEFTYPPDVWVFTAEELEEHNQRVRDDEARKAADRVEALEWLDGGRTVNRNAAIIAARRNLKRLPAPEED
jgi:hypothetical protein